MLPGMYLEFFIVPEKAVISLFASSVVGYLGLLWLHSMDSRWLPVKCASISFLYSDCYMAAYHYLVQSGYVQTSTPAIHLCHHFPLS